MNKQSLIELATVFVEEAAANRVSREIALSEEVVGMQIFLAPIFGFAAADDPYFRTLREPEVVGPHFRLPAEWLPSARTVVSFFLPFTEVVKQGNSRDTQWPSTEWLHARIEGQAFLVSLCKYLQAELQGAGYASVVPSLDERFRSGVQAGTGETQFTSNWSERHVAFVSGLGTFGLSKGIITSQGMAGRLGSIVTELPIQPSIREYTGVYEYCSMCGVCVRNCPAQAIALKTGKNHQLCSDFLDQTREKHRPRYGCGKCQVQVPCSSQIPKKI